MSNNQGDEPRQGARGHREPHADTAGPDAAAPEGERASEGAPGPHHLRSLESLERLRDRIETAAHELKRLREENRALAERIHELEARPAVDAQRAFVSLDTDPELLRRKITGFIETIDRYLEKENARS